MEILINGRSEFVLEKNTNYRQLIAFVEKKLGLKSKEYYLISNGKRIDDGTNFKCTRIHIVPTAFGGKGGFGSMLRAIGAQIEKTTNREACRDLSGRRLRDINEEQRLKTWINQQAEREKEAKEKKQKKLERLCEAPKHIFKDEQYDKERSELPEQVEDAVLQGLQASCSTKRKVTEEKQIVKKKKPKLWMDDELEDDLSSSGDESDESDPEEKKVANVTTKTSDTESSNSSSSTKEASKDIEHIENMVNTGNSGIEGPKDEETTRTVETDGLEQNEESSEIKDDEQKIEHGMVDKVDIKQSIEQ